jgi:NADPH:quinone reductase-like Zn-dependent oxidoreductase
MPLELPAVLGRDVSGEVLELGAGVTGFRVGDKVFGLVNHGYAELVTAPAANFAMVPSGLDPRDAAALPVVSLTGAQLVEEGIDARPGQTVLITGAIGAVGRFAVYCAKARGAKVIAGVRTKQLGEAKDLGADSVIALDDAVAVAALPSLDAVADTTGGQVVIDQLTAKVKNGGVIASVAGNPTGDSSRNVTGRNVRMHPDARRLLELANAVKAGAVQLTISKRFPLDQAAQAHQFAEQGGVGKVLLTV